MHTRRFTRLTDAFSKKVENHKYAVALFAMYYNFVRIHKTLRTTPAMPDSASPSWNRRTKTSACLRKLSPKAENAWHQNKGAKRRVVIRDVDMALLVPFRSGPILL